MVLATKFEMKTSSGVTIFTPLFNSCVNIVTPLLNSGVTIFTQRLFTPRSWNNTNYNTGMVLQRDTFRFSYNIILMFFSEKYVNKYFYDKYVNKYLSKKSNVGKFYNDLTVPLECRLSVTRVMLECRMSAATVPQQCH